MKLAIFVKPGSRKPGIEVGPDGSWIVRVREPAQDGKANEAVLRALADHLGVPRSRLGILHGQTGRRKLVEVQGVDNP